MKSNRISKKKHSKWIQLTVFKNCFNDGENVHLGFKYNGRYYMLTHSKSKVIVPKKYLRMNHIDEESIEYLAVARSRPKPLNLTNMRISKHFFYNEALKILHQKKSEETVTETEKENQ